jgi:hypothetical protein
MSAYSKEVAANIRRNVKKALTILHSAENYEALHDFLIHIDCLASEIENERDSVRAE